MMARWPRSTVVGSALVNVIKDNLATPARIAAVMEEKALDLVAGTRR